MAFPNLPAVTIEKFCAMAIEARSASEVLRGLADPQAGIPSGALIVTLPTAGMSILAAHRMNDGNQRASSLGIISERVHLGGMVRMKQTVSKFETRPTPSFRPRLRDTPKTSVKKGV
jgi:hypothetical protein